MGNAHRQGRLARRSLGIAAVATVLLLVPALARADAGHREAAAARETSDAAQGHGHSHTHGTSIVRTATAGKPCSKLGQVRGSLTCTKVNGHLQWAKTPGQGSSSAAADALCRASTYTAQVRNLRCSAREITFGANGLPGDGAPMMVGITATNQQYPTAHDYSYTFPRSPSIASAPTVPGDGAIGVAVNGVPLFSPWTQAALLQHTLEAGELDVCGGHAGRGDDYHYHIAPVCLIKQLGAQKIEQERSPIGIANDGYPIRALGWFTSANDITGRLDRCQGMTDANGMYFYNVASTRPWDILDCFTGVVVPTSRDRFTTRTDSTGQQIIGAKVAMTITGFTARSFGGQTCNVMTGNLVNQKVIQTNQNVVATSAPTTIFYCSPTCYAEFFEPTAPFPGQSVYLEEVVRSCPAGFDPNSFTMVPAYAGPNIGKRGPATRSSVIPTSP